MSTLLKTVFLVNAILAVTFGLFIEICKLCAVLDVSPWLSIPGTMLVCGGAYLLMLRAAARRFG